MKSETMLATEKMLDVVKILFDEVRPESLFVKILEVARDVLHADAAVLDIAGENPLHLSNPEQVSISISAVRLAKTEKRAVVWNQLDDNSANLSRSIVQNQLTSIMVSPFRTPDSESGYLYLQRAARKDSFTEEDSALFDSFVFVVFQYLYLETQAFVGRLNAVYGVLAAIPLFLIWLNFSWQIIIYGAELTRALQEVDNVNISDWESDK